MGHAGHRERASGRHELVTNGTKIRGYDPATGKLLWTLGPNSEVTVGTPVAVMDWCSSPVVIHPCARFMRFAPAPAATSLCPRGVTRSGAIAWSNMTDGTYIPTPLVYGGHLFTINNNGIVDAYKPGDG